MKTLIQRYWPGLRRRLVPPRLWLEVDKFHFDVVHGCQLRCVGCPNSTLKPKVRFISVEDFDRCLRHVDVKVVRLLRLFNFGEPLLHPRMAELLNVARRQRFSIGHIEIGTNGQHRNHGVLADVLKTGALDNLVVSCDGDGTPQDYERLRPPGKWHVLLAFLEKAKELKDAHSPHTRLLTRTICAEKEGQERWRRHLEPRGWTPGFRDWINLPEAQEKSARGKTGPREGVCSFMSPTSENLYVDHDGAVLPCCVYPRPFVLGSLMDERYSRVRRGQAWRSMFERMSTDRKNMRACCECDM